MRAGPLLAGIQTDGARVAVAEFTTFLSSLISLCLVCLVQWLTTILSVDAEYPT